MCRAQEMSKTRCMTYTPSGKHGKLNHDVLLKQGGWAMFNFHACLREGMSTPTEDRRAHQARGLALGAGDLWESTSVTGSLRDRNDTKKLETCLPS